MKLLYALEKKFWLVVKTSKFLYISDKTDKLHTNFAENYGKG